MPLVSMAFKDHKGQVRRKVIALMRSTHRQEGIWNSLLTAKVAERVMEIEDDGLDGGGKSRPRILMSSPTSGIRFEGGSNPPLRYTWNSWMLLQGPCHNLGPA